MSGTDVENMGSRGQKEHRILVIGKTGNGKSSVCNTITKSQHFRTGRSMTSTTLTVQHEDVFINGQYVRVIDTPDVTNGDLTQRQMEEEVARWREVAGPYPTAVLLTVRCDVRYTAEEFAIYRQLKNLWGDYSLQHNLVVAFTFGDRQDVSIEEELKTVCPELKSVLRDANNRYFVFSNKEANRDIQWQLISFLERRIVDSGPPFYMPISFITRVLILTAVVSGLCFAATITANKSGWAVGFGLICLAAGIGVVATRIKQKWR